MFPTIFHQISTLLLVKYIEYPYNIQLGICLELAYCYGLQDYYTSQYKLICLILHALNVDHTYTHYIIYVCIFGGNVLWERMQVFTKSFLVEATKFLCYKQIHGDLKLNTCIHNSKTP